MEEKHEDSNMHHSCKCISYTADAGGGGVGGVRGQQVGVLCIAVSGPVLL